MSQEHPDRQEAQDELASLATSWQKDQKGRFLRLAIRGVIGLIIFGLLATKYPWGKWLLIGYAILIVISAFIYWHLGKKVMDRATDLQAKLDES